MTAAASCVESAAVFPELGIPGSGGMPDMTSVGPFTLAEERLVVSWPGAVVGSGIVCGTLDERSGGFSALRLEAAYVGGSPWSSSVTVPRE